jgi:hypothetical protein
MRTLLIAKAGGAWRISFLEDSDVMASYDWEEMPTDLDRLTKDWIELGVAVRSDGVLFIP